MDENFSAGSQRGFGDADFAYQTLFAGYDLVAAGAHRDAHQEGGDDSEWNAHRQRGYQADAHFRNRPIYQQQAADDEQRNSADGEHAVGGELGFEREERE